MGATLSCSCTTGSNNGSKTNDREKEEEIKTNCVRSLCAVRRNLIFPNEILENIMAFLSIRDKLVAREVCMDWCIHINTAGNLQETVKIRVCSDELNYLAETSPVFTSFYFHKLDITRQSLNFWSLYSDIITCLEFYDCSVIPRNTNDSNQPNFHLGCPNLKHLGLVNCDKYFLMGGTFIQLNEILYLENLETLNLSQNKNLSDSIIFSILLKTKQLQKLDLSDCVNMVFMKAVHNRFYPSGKPRPPYSDHVLSFHTLCSDFLQTSRASRMTCFNFGMKFNSTGMSLLLTNDIIKWKYANLESPELKISDILQFIQHFHQNLLKVEFGRCKLSAKELFDANMHLLQDISLYDSRNITNLQFLTTMPNLHRLILDGTNGFELSSECFRLITNLSELSLNGVKPVNNAESCRIELRKIFSTHPKITALDIGNCPQIVNDNLVQDIITYLKGLKRLNLEASTITNIGLCRVQTSPTNEVPETFEKSDVITHLCLSKLSDIEYLNLSHCRDLNELTWQVPAKLINLVSLNLSNCNTLSKRGILSVINNCRNLEKLVLIHCPAPILTDPEVVSCAREKLYRCRGIIY